MHSADITDLFVSGVIIAFAGVALFVLIPAGIDDPGSIDVLALGPAFRLSVISAFLGVMGARGRCAGVALTVRSAGWVRFRAGRPG